MMLNLVTLVVLSLPLDVLAITVNPDILTLRRAGGDLGEILAGAPGSYIKTSILDVVTEIVGFRGGVQSTI